MLWKVRVNNHSPQSHQTGAPRIAASLGLSIHNICKDHPSAVSYPDRGKHSVMQILKIMDVPTLLYGRVLKWKK
jgi:hypothetical protein